MTLSFSAGARMARWRSPCRRGKRRELRLKRWQIQHGKVATGSAPFKAGTLQCMRAMMRNEQIEKLSRPGWAWCVQQLQCGGCRRDGKSLLFNCLKVCKVWGSSFFAGCGNSDTSKSNETCCGCALKNAMTYNHYRGPPLTKGIPISWKLSHDSWTSFLSHLPPTLVANRSSY